MRVVIVGAGGHGMVVADILYRMRQAGASVEPVAFVDDRPSPDRPSILSLPVIAGGLAALRSIQFDAVIVAIGDNATRRRIGEHLRRSGTPLATACHPSSVIGLDVEVGTGAMVCAGAVLNPAVRIGVGAILNTHCSVDHHNSIGDYAHVAPGAHLGGEVSIGGEALIGIGATVTPRCRIGNRAVVGAGSVVVRDLPDDVVVWGVPARVHVVAHLTRAV